MHTSFEQLLLKKLLGTITAKEEMDFNLWLKVNPVYDTMYMERKRNWDETQLEAPEFAPTFQRNVDLNYPDTKKSSSKRFVIANDVALVLTIVVSLFFYRGVRVDPRKIVADDKAISVTLTDNTLVSLKPHSTLVVPAGFPSKRTVELQGNANFNVKNVPGKPLIINTLNSRTEVLGTSSVLVANEQNNADEVIVLEGRARLSSKQNADKNVIVTPGVRGKVFNQTDHPTLTDIDTVNLAALKTDRLTFRNAKLYDVAHTISTYYNVDVHVHDGLTGCTFTGSFSNVSLNEVLEALREAMPVKITTNKGKIMFDGQACEASNE
jgi:transmembrane sensor